MDVLTPSVPGREDISHSATISLVDAVTSSWVEEEIPTNDTEEGGSVEVKNLGGVEQVLWMSKPELVLIPQIADLQLVPPENPSTLPPTLGQHQHGEGLPFYVCDLPVRFLQCLRIHISE